MDNEMILTKLMELDFMAVDLGLFLDTHPENEEAIAEYNKIVKAADALRGKYEKLVGPVCSFRSVNRCDDKWLCDDCPWPWSRDFNCKGGC